MYGYSSTYQAKVDWQRERNKHGLETRQKLHGLFACQSLQTGGIHQNYTRKYSVKNVYRRVGGDAQSFLRESFMVIAVLRHEGNLSYHVIKFSNVYILVNTHHWT